MIPLHIADNHYQGLVTSAQKLNRKGLTEKYKKDIDTAYGK